MEKPIVLGVENTTKFTILLPSKGHIRIFDTKDCRELKDLMNREYANGWILKPKGSHESLAVEDAFPEVPFEITEVDLIIYISGFVLVDQNEDQKITSFVEVTLFRDN